LKDTLANSATINTAERLDPQPDSAAAPRIAVAGISGYAGGELARLLLRHRKLRGATPTFLGRVGEAESGPPTYLEDIHPQLAMPGDRRVNEVFPFSWKRITDSGTELLFLATPHEQSRDWVPEAIARSIKVIDLRTGGVRSNFFENLPAAPALPRDSIYAPAREAIEKSMTGDTLPAAVASQRWAEQVVRDLLSPKPPIHVWRGQSAWMIWFIRRFMPHTLPDGMLSKMAGLDVLVEKLAQGKEK